MEKEIPTHLEDSIYGAFSLSASAHIGDYGGRTKKSKGKGYEVYMNFRGRDIRKGFGDYLYTSLVDAGVHVFRDEEICVGAKIGFDFLPLLHRLRSRL